MKKEDYETHFYQNSGNKHIPVLEYISALSLKAQAKIDSYIKLLRDHKGRLSEPYSRHIRSGIRELRIEISRNRHRVLYVVVENKRIILLHAFLKKTRKTPQKHIDKALDNYEDYKQNKKSIKFEM